MKTKEFDKFSTIIHKREKTNISKKFQIVESLHQEAITLGIIPPKNPLEGLDVDLRIAKVINSVSKIT